MIQDPKISKVKPRRVPSCALTFVCFFLFLPLGILTLRAPSATAQIRDQTRKPPGNLSNKVTLKTIREQISKIQLARDLDDRTEEKVLELYLGAEDNLELATSYAERAERYKAAVSSAPLETKRIVKTQKQMDDGRISTKENRAYRNLSLENLEQLLLKQQSEFTSQEQELKDLENRIREEHSRPEAIREQLTDAQQQERVQSKLRAPPQPGSLPLVDQAHKAAVETELAALDATISMLNQELASYNVRFELLAARRNLAARETSRAQARIKSLQEAVNIKRHSEAERLESETARLELEYADKPPLLRKLVKKNAELSENQTNLSRRLARISVINGKTEAHLKRIKQDFDTAKHKLDIAGLSPALQHILQNQRRTLPEIAGYQRDSKKRQQELIEVSLTQLRIDESRRTLDRFDEVVQTLLNEETNPKLSQDQAKAIDKEVRQLLWDRQGILTKLSNTHTKYARMLGDLDFNQRQVIDTAQQYAAFLDQRLFWIPSAQPISGSTIIDLALGVAWITSPTMWVGTGQALLDDASSAPGVYLTALLVFVALLIIRQKLHAYLDSIAEWVAKPYADRFYFTVQAFFATLAAAGPWTALIAFGGWRLTDYVESADYSSAIGAGLTAVALPLLLIEGFRLLCIGNGVARVHFDWREETITVVRRHLSWLIPIAVPTLFISNIANASANEEIADSLGRLAFMFSMSALAFFFQRVFSTHAGVTYQVSEHTSKSWVFQSRWLWYPVLVGLPIILVFLAGIGFSYSALQLGDQLIATLCLVIGTVILYHFVIRWLIVEKRRLVLFNLRKQREAKRAAEDAKSVAGATSDILPAAQEVPEIDIETIDVQTRKLLNNVIGLGVIIGLWLIWAEVFPALSILDQLSLWERTVQIDGQDFKQAVTLTNLALAIVFGALALTAARNIPGVLEIVMLRKLSMDSGSRYAVATLSRYLIGATGVIVVFNQFGGSWAQIQWLVAALGVGLGFGLQEIFANFVSGLIILFERPIRVGDTVTVSDISGVVSRINIRATTIVDWDRKELIVPNKSFITGRLINWSLSDPITRIVIPVGIAYGSETESATRLMLDVTRQNALVLDDPEPSVLFLGFGDSALNFEVRVFVHDPVNRLPLIHALHIALEKALRENGIVMPFPQRDINIRTSAEQADTGLDANALRPFIRR